MSSEEARIYQLRSDYTKAGVEAQGGFEQAPSSMTPQPSSTLQMRAHSCQSMMTLVIIIILSLSFDLIPTNFLVHSNLISQADLGDGEEPGAETTQQQEHILKCIWRPYF